ncbi:PIG-L deacetylase family protein [Paenibacillus koleovorans]|uniref:PIG-L deacetylase family protein n=1 Tax=Paenibacillus koleovorans TaxID=121608 RepID=UPI000FDB244E|nr:PIG-L deacetylase family protein [Paenibacillus koleovorans]
MKRTIMVVASHPDDELLGPGGTLRKLIKDGHEVVTVLTAKGRKEEDHHMRTFIERANASLGVKEVVWLALPNLELECAPLHQLNAQLEQLMQLHRPDTVFTHHYGDLNRDHQITFQAVATAARPIAGKPPVELICFETVSSTEWTPASENKTFKPNYYVDITDTMQDKLEALRHYDVEMRPFPHPRSYEGVEYLARVRGMTVGVPYGEAFEIVRRVWK